MVSAATALTLVFVARPLGAHGPTPRRAGPPAPRVPTYRVLDVGTLQEGVSSLFRGINNAGQGAGGSGTFGSGHRAFVLSSTRVGPSGPPASDYSRAFRLKDLGDVVGSVHEASDGPGHLQHPRPGTRLRTTPP